MGLNLEDKFKKMFKCDSARISKPVDKLFLIIGYKRHTIDYKYIDERVIASGENEQALIESAKRYKKLLEICKAYKMQDGTFDWVEYLKKYDFDGNRIKV